MSLTLITGPANAAKAGAAFERLRALRPRDPLLVVPTPADADFYRAELAASGLVLAPAVATFDGLMRLVARRTGVTRRVLGPVARERVVRAAVASVPLERLAASAGSAGFARAVGEALAELERALVSPARLESAIAAWRAEEPEGRHAQAQELAALYRTYLRRMAALGAHDREGHAWAALDALRRDPGAWERRPVLFYGFDDLTRAQLDAVEALVRAEAEVVVTLPYEAGRVAFAGRATTVAVLAPLAGEHVELPARSEHYAPAAREPLHHLERRLFEPGAPRAQAGTAVRLLEAGGERAEAELVGAEVLSLIDRAVAPAEIAVLVRGGSPERDLTARVLEAYGIPVSRRRRLPFGHTRLGAGVLSLARIAAGAGEAGDLLRWARTPGCLADPEPADRLEAAIRRAASDSLDAARALWRGPERLLAELDEVRAAAGLGTLELLRTLLGRAEATWRAAHTRSAAVLDPEEALDARVAEALRAAVAELEGLAQSDASLVDGRRAVLEVLGALEVTDPGEADGVLIADPLDIRARRFRAVLATGLQDGRFPRRPPPDPFLGDEDRRALARASGLRLPGREDVMADERHLLYAVCSRPQEELVLSWRSSTEEGDPLQPSVFLDDIRVLFGPELWERRRRRLLAEVTWPADAAPTALEAARARAAARSDPEPGPPPPPRSPAVLALLAARESESARGLETFARCPVAWMVQSMLRPARFGPDTDPMWRGSLAHAILEGVLVRLRDGTGSARLTPERLPVALEVLAAEVRSRAPAGLPAARRATLSALEADLARYLRQECGSGPGLEPVALEWSFGGARDEHPALELTDGTRVSGRVDRVDAGAGQAVVRDYKHAQKPAGARWSQDRSLQAGLYALAVERLLGLRPRGVVYQPLSGGDLRPRGIVAEGLEGVYVGNDVLGDDAFGAALAEVEALAMQAAQGIRTGEIRPCPSLCSARGCLHPGICRAGEERPPGESGNGEAA